MFQYVQGKPTILNLKNTEVEKIGPIVANCNRFEFLIDRKLKNNLWHLYNIYTTS